MHISPSVRHEPKVFFKTNRFTLIRGRFMYRYIFKNIFTGHKMIFYGHLSRVERKTGVSQMVVFPQT